MSDARIQRARLLVRQGRHPEAAAELRHALGEQPEDLDALYLLVLAERGQGRLREAQQMAQRLVELAPQSDLGHYALGLVRLSRSDFAGAEACARAALEREPEDANDHELLARALYGQRRWAESERATLAGLAHAPEHEGLLQLRGLALQAGGQRDEAGRVFESALQSDPGNAYLHTSKGWLELERGRPREALQHFRDALGRDPTLERAREGIVQALGARFLPYRVLLRFYLWMGRLSPRARWGVIVGGYIGSRALRALGQAQPELLAYTLPVLVIYWAFVIATWTAEPLLHLALRFHPLGRLALTRRQTRSANTFGACLLGLAASVALIAWGESAAGLCFALTFAALTLVAPKVWNCPRGWRLWSALGLLAGMLACGGFAGVRGFGLEDLREDDRAMLALSTLLVLALVSQFAFSALQKIEDED